MRYIGVHVSISGGVDKSIERVKMLSINAAQIFLRNSNRWSSLPYRSNEIDRFQHKRNDLKNLKLFAHSIYLINLAGDKEVLIKSIDAMHDEILRSEQLGIEYIVIHPGNHKGKGEPAGIKLIAKSLDTVFSMSKQNNVKILLETTSGQGTSIGYKFEHLRDIIGLSKYPERLFVCLDTCHIFAAGYDISTKKGYNDVMEGFHSIIGLEKLRLIHLNDSKKKLGSRRDRHEHIGEGLIGDTGFRILLHDKRLLKIPVILETPKFNEFEADQMNLKRVYEIIKKR